MSSDAQFAAAPSPFRQPVPRRVLPKVAETRVGGPIRQIEPLAGGWLVTIRDEDALTILDERLHLRRRIVVPAPIGRLAFAKVTTDEAGVLLIAVSAPNGVGIYHCDPADDAAHLLWETGHARWRTWEQGACTFDGAARLWWVHPESQETDRIVVSDARTGVTIAAAPIERQGCGYRFALHPSGSAVMLDGGAGQDGSFLWRASLSPQGLAVQDLGSSDRTMGSFSPDGSRFVTAPHDAESISIHRWPDATVIDSIEAAAIFSDETEVEDEAALDSFGYVTAFLDGQHVIADTMQRRLLLLTTGPLALAAELWPESNEIRGYGEREQPVADPADAVDYTGDLDTWAVAGDRLATSHAGGHFALWDLSGFL